jgi:hypothetical protein
MSSTPPHLLPAFFVLAFKKHPARTYTYYIILTLYVQIGEGSEFKKLKTE